MPTALKVCVNCKNCSKHDLESNIWDYNCTITQREVTCVVTGNKTLEYDSCVNKNKKFECEDFEWNK